MKNNEFEKHKKPSAACGKKRWAHANAYVKHSQYWKINLNVSESKIMQLSTTEQLSEINMY